MSSQGDSPTSSDNSLFCRKYNLPSLKGNLADWDRAWEKTLLTLSASDDVYPIVYAALKRLQLMGGFDGHYKAVCKFQKALVDLMEDCAETIFSSAWKFVDEEERKKHLLKGMKTACESVSFSQDSRAMCPEITTTAMLERQGMVFINFARNLSKAIKEQDAEKVYMLPSDWWMSAVKLPQPWSEDALFTFTQLSAVRNEFIAQFVYHSIKSLMFDMTERTPAMKKVIRLIATEQYQAMSDAMTTGPIRDKPLIRCENCTKTQEEQAFMVCSRCRLKLGFTVHYCSQACQKEDWRNHKKYCGKKKVAKKLTGTIHDVFWRYPTIPNFMRPTELTPDAERLEVESLGFGAPHPSRPHSAALQRQVSLLEADKRADYFLFDEAGAPIRFEIKNITVKRVFRYARRSALCNAEPICVDQMAEHLIKKMGHGPALSRARILAQLKREYEVDIEAKVMAVEAQVVAEAYNPAISFFEMMST